jgi:hypothetical protein
MNEKAAPTKRGLLLGQPEDNLSFVLWDQG